MEVQRGDRFKLEGEEWTVLHVWADEQIAKLVSSGGQRKQVKFSKLKSPIKDADEPGTEQKSEEGVEEEGTSEGTGSEGEGEGTESEDEDSPNLENIEDNL